MATLNLSTNGPSISKSYQSVINSSVPAAGSSTYGKWAIFSVSTPLVNAFQQDAASKESVLKVQDAGEGDLADLIDEFSEGKIQFAFVKVIDPNTGLPKNVLIAWCGEGVPERTKGYFTSHLSTVAKFLHGYHVQITARSERDLTAEGIIQKIGDASGAKYTAGLEKPTVNAPKPPIPSKPAFNPLRTGGTNAITAPNIPVRTKATHDDDGWGPDAPPVTRTNLEKVRPAYQPTKVNIQALRSEGRSEIATVGSEISDTRDDVVKGGYQPIGKVDIAAIRRQAREAGDLKDDRPGPVKGAYEPIGKVDIAAIRSRAQKVEEPSVLSEDSPSISRNPPETAQNSDSIDYPVVPDHSGRLTTLPKPKVSNKFGGGTASFTGTKPSLPSDNLSKSKSTPQVGSASRTFADQGGKTPAQIWAEKKARERGQDPTSAVPPPIATEPPIQAQNSGKAEWKSSYTGKSWAPVQTTHTGRSVGSNSSATRADISANEPQVSQQNVEKVPTQFVQDQPQESHEDGLDDDLEVDHDIPTSNLPNKSTEDEPSYVPDVHEPALNQPHITRSPTPPSPPVRETSPIRVAIPVASGVSDAHHDPDLPPTTHIDDPGSSYDKFPHTPQDVASAGPGHTNDENPQSSGIQAIVQYDYEKAEDNEISLEEGEFVTEIDMVDKDWWIGLNARGERGLFPSNYVDLVEDNQQGAAEPDVHEQAHLKVESAPQPNLATVSGKPTATALYDYEAAEDNELSFPEGAEISNIEFPDDDWWLGEYLNSKGLFPANYVQLRK